MKVNEIAYIFLAVYDFSKRYSNASFRIFIFRIYEDIDYETNIENV